jgi:hypothetical protein
MMIWGFYSDPNSLRLVFYVLDRKTLSLVLIQPAISWQNKHYIPGNITLGIQRDACTICPTMLILAFFQGLWGLPPKESVGAPDQTTVSQNSKSEGWPSDFRLQVFSGKKSK